MRKLFLVSILLLLSGCSITQNVNPARTDRPVDTIYVEYNRDVQMSEIHGVIADEIRRQGFEASIYRGERPEEAVHYFTFTANWGWDLAVYLSYFHGQLFEDGEPVGLVEYDARQGGGTMEKFGPTEEKVRPLIRELLQDLSRE